MPRRSAARPGPTKSLSGTEPRNPPSGRGHCHPSPIRSQCRPGADVTRDTSPITRRASRSPIIV
eukprot:687853-Hanusia_phi.AAC.1